MEEVKPKKNKKVALIIINIIAVLVIAGAASYIFYFKGKLAEDTTASLVKIGERAGFMGQGNFDVENICEMFNERGERSENFPQNRPANMPEDMPDFDPEQMQGQFGEMRALIEEICEDGKVDDEEKEKLEEMQESMPSPPNR